MKFNRPPRSFTLDAKFAAVEGTNGQPNKLRGYAMVWGVLSSDRGGYRVRILRGAPTFTAPTQALYDHDTIGGPLGDTESGTLRILTPDDFGQPVEVDLPDTTLGRDTFTLVKSRRVRGMSFSMLYSGVEWRDVRENGLEIMEAIRFVCDEVTVTSRPAFTESNIDVAPEHPGQHSLPPGDAAGLALAGADAARFDGMRFRGLILP